MNTLIEENQLVGTGGGFAVFRNLYQTPTGERVSVKTSRVFCILDERKPGESYPPTEVLFNKHRR